MTVERKLKSLKLYLDKSGLKDAASMVLGIIKVCQESSHVFDENDKNWGNVAKRIYKRSTYTHPVHGDRNTESCINWSGVGEELNRLHKERLGDIKGEYIQRGAELKYPSFQSMVDDYNDAVQNVCVKGEAYRGHADSLSGSACIKTNDYGSGETFNQALVNRDAECILGEIGMLGKKELFFALIQAESSRLGQGAKSGAGAFGLAQLTPIAVKEMERVWTANGKVEYINNFDVEGSGHDNMAVAALYLKNLLRKYNGDEYRALASYNWGPGNLDNAIRGNSMTGRDISAWFTTATKPSFLEQETYDYVRKIKGL